jgi:hypothetical protein
VRRRGGEGGRRFVSEDFFLYIFNCYSSDQHMYGNRFEGAGTRFGFSLSTFLILVMLFLCPPLYVTRVTLSLNHPHTIIHTHTHTTRTDTLSYDRHLHMRQFSSIRKLCWQRTVECFVTRAGESLFCLRTVRFGFVWCISTFLHVRMR